MLLYVSKAHHDTVEVRTYSTTVGSAGDNIVLKLEVWIKDGVVELRSAVEAVADSRPVSCCFRHCPVAFSSSGRRLHEVFYHK